MQILRLNKKIKCRHPSGASHVETHTIIFYPRGVVVMNRAASDR